MNAENVTLHHRNKLHFKIYYKNIYLQYYCAYNQMNAAMVKKKKCILQNNITDPKLLNDCV